MLPTNLPNSFKTKLQNDELYSIAYTFYVYFDSDEPILQYSKDVVINQNPKLAKRQETMLNKFKKHSQNQVNFLSNLERTNSQYEEEKS